MSNRWFRFVIALVAIGAAGAAGYRILQHEQQLARLEASSRASTLAAESAITTISEIKAALHAYVAAGQEHDFWIARAGMLLDKLRGSLAELDQAEAGTAAATDEVVRLDRLAAAEKRARNHLAVGQLLLAGEVIFTDARDVLDAMRIEVAGARNTGAQAADRQNAALRREQAMLALGAAGVLVLAVLVLVPPGRITPNVPVAASAASASASVPRTTPTTRAPARTTPVAAAQRSVADSRGSRSVPGPPVPATVPDAPTALPAPELPLAEAAAVCTDMGRVSQSNEIAALLGRAAKVLSASGVIVWVASENRDELFPAAASGYDQRLFERIGSIRRDASNLTAASFRRGGARTSPGGGGSPAALAVPLLTPHGPVGVFSAELREVSDVDANRLAVATIFAAQLANLLGSMNTNLDAAASIDGVSQAQAQNG